MKLITDPKWPDWLKRDPKSGYWRVVQYRADKLPRRIDKSTGEKTSIQRARMLGEKILAKWLGHEIDGSPRRMITREACVFVINDMQTRVRAGTLRASTLVNARLYIEKYIVEDFGHFRVDQVEDAWSRFVADYQARFPGKKLYNHWKHLALVMNRAYKMGGIDKPWTVRCPDVRTKAGRVLTEEEKTAILRVALPQLRDQLMFAMTMGMRLREHLKLEWDRVNLEKETITLRAEDTKTGKPRTVRMSPQVLEVLQRRHKRKHPTSPFVFPARGKPSQPTHQNKSAWGSAKRLAKISGRCRYHDLRHTFLSECAKKVRAGEVSLPVICAYAGLNISVFERVYLHLNEQDTAGVSKLVAVKVGE